MAAQVQTRPVEDSVSKVNDEVAVGENLEFQRRWWRFERIIWSVFLLILIADVLGCFGRGPLAKARTATSDGSMNITYERVERFGTPSILTIHFGKSAIRDGKVQLWVSDSLIKELGNQRVVPQPASSTLDGKGILYTFPVTPHPNSIEFALEPSSPGIFSLTFRVPGMQEADIKIYVMP